MISTFQFPTYLIIARNMLTSKVMISRSARALSCGSLSMCKSSETSKKKVTLKTKERSTYPKIYTKTGDGGKSSLFTGERRIKSDRIFEVLGTIDELSSHLGLVIASAGNSDYAYLDQLQRIQCILQDIGSLVATPNSSARAAHKERVVFNDRHANELEEWIDEYTNVLPPLESFILPGGSLASSNLHVARSVCRRAERRLQPLVEDKEVDIEAMKYINRLSDFLFTLARFAAKIDQKEEMIYIRPDPKMKIYTPVSPDVWKKSKE